MRKANYISPAKIVDIAMTYGDKGMCVSFQEPILLFEYSLDVFKIAKQKGLYNCYVSNGYMTVSALKMLKTAGLTGLKIDVKGTPETYKKYCGDANIEYVWRNANLAKKLGIHVEIVNLVITDVNDDEHSIKDLIIRHLREVGEDTPLHFTRYYPAYKFHKQSTKIETLEYAYKTAKKLGVQYPYLGNVPGHKYENTYCRHCNNLIIKRYGYSVRKLLIKNGRCMHCNKKVKIRV
jgi:pyruvate formate lyase activating enzyme